LDILIVAAQRRMEFWLGHYADPVYLTGDYPASMRLQLGDRLPRFTPEESALVKGSSDFYGMNTYTSDYIKDKNHLGPAPEEDYFGNVEITQVGPDGKQMGPQAECSWLQDGTSPSFD
jgi:beta-glucosidase